MEQKDNKPQKEMILFLIALSVLFSCTINAANNPPSDVSSYTLTTNFTHDQNRSSPANSATTENSNNTAVVSASGGTDLTNSYNAKFPGQTTYNLAPGIYILSALLFVLLWIQIATPKQQLHVPTSLGTQTQHQYSPPKVIMGEPTDATQQVS